MLSFFSHASSRILAACMAAAALVGIAAPAHAQQRRVQPFDYNHFVFEGGGGFSAPTGSSGGQLEYGWNAMGGVGYRTGRSLSTIAEYQFDRFSIPTRVLNQLGEPDGNVHLWSLTLNEKLNFTQSGAFRPYVVGGGGFYRELVSFTEPITETGTYCDYFYCYPVQYTTNVVLSHSSSNQGGADIGAGFEHRLSDYSNAKIFGEARYTWVNTPGHSTQVVPVSFGLRF